MIKLLFTKAYVFIGLLGVFLMASNVSAQTVVNTTHTDNNGASMVTFNVQNTNAFAIIITEFRCVASSANATTVLYNPNPTNNVGTWSSGIVGAGQNGWVLVGNGTTTGGSVVTPFLTGASLVTIPPATTYQFAISTTNIRYMTLTAGSVNTFTGGGVNILTGDGISWGGAAAPATPVNYPRGFVGGITWIPGTPPLAEDAGITGFVNPVIPTCAFNDSVAVTLKNFGTDTLTSVNINWKRNVTNLAPIFWTGSLAPTASTTVFVGTTPYTTGDNLYAWTTNPNGVIENSSGSINDSASIIGLSTGLSGTYTIGGLTPDFNNIPAAITALNFAGVCGPVVFNIRSGTQYDQFSLINVVGMNATNTVTFRSEVGHRDSVIIDYGAAATANNYVIKMTDADYFRFESMTIRNSNTLFGRVFDISGGSDYNVIYDCNIHSVTSNSTSLNFIPVYSANGNDNYNTFEKNSIIGGSYGAYWYGAAIASLEVGNVWKNNEFVDNYWYGLRPYYQENIQVVGNRFHGQSTYTSTRYGIYAWYCDKSSIFTHNSIESNPSTMWTYGMYFGNNDGSAAFRGLVANNSITVGSPTSTAVIYGMFITASGFIDFYNNSVSVVGGTSATSRAFYITGGGANNVKNNTFSNFGAGYASYVIGTYAINEMDYNNQYSTGVNICYFDAANTPTYANWLSASGYDANGVNVNPGFYSAYDLHLCSDSLNAKGTPLALITDDIDLQPRNTTTPDIGSDEFAPLGQPGFLGPNALVCTGQTVSLSAGAPSDQIQWSTGDTTNTLVVTIPGTYTVTVIGACGISFDTVVVTQSALTYTGFLNASATNFCSGGSALLTSTMPATTYAWTGGSTNDSLVVTSSGNYTLNITDACGTGSQTVAITVNTAPVASFTTTQSFLSGAFTNTSSTGGSPATYLWNFGDNTTSTEMSPSHIYTTIGTFTVTLTVTNACGTATSTGTITTSNLGLEEVEGLGSIAVYPNPTSGVFNVDFNTTNDINVLVNVSNVLGQTVYTKNIGSINGTHNDVIDITNEALGIYYVTIVSDNNTMMTRKIVKQ